MLHANILPPQSKRIDPVPRSQSATGLARTTAIGSCRVLAPLKTACTGNDVTLNQNGVYGYCHSSTEALQQIIHLQAGSTPPAHLLPVIAPKNQIEGLWDTRHQASDIYFVELSSAKLLTVDDHPIQLNYLTRHFADFFSDIATTRTYWSLVRLGQHEERRSFLARNPEFQKLDDADRHILCALALTFSTLPSLVSDIKAIRKRLEDVVFVTHFDAHKHDGKPLKARADFLHILRKALAKANARSFDPSDYVAALGQADALEKGRSLSHYSTEFIELLARNWKTRYIGPHIQKYTAARPMPATRPGKAQIDLKSHSAA